jgi:hypothetical protein
MWFEKIKNYKNLGESETSLILLLLEKSDPKNLGLTRESYLSK